MQAKTLSDSAYWKANISWSRPRKWYQDENDLGVYLGDNLSYKYGVYRFEARSNNASRLQNILLYIGIAYEQDFDTRLHQGYHESKLKKINYDNIWVSTGVIEFPDDSNHTLARYKEIESVLIYFFKPQLNIQKIKYAPIESFCDINNHGYRGALPKRIVFPTAGIVR